MSAVLEREVAELRANAATAERVGDHETARTLARWADELEARR